MKSRKILLAITASIAAYKAAMLVRLLIKSGAEVKVIMTESAKKFITPLTLSTLSKNPVYSEFTISKQGEWVNHVELGLWADLMLIAPATANTIAKMATGVCDNLVLATYLSAKCPVFIAPAMDLDMFAHRTTQKNLKTLESFGNIIIDAETGDLASGLTGKGRMAEPENIIAFIENKLSENKPLKGKIALVTAGPTYENIDPVRFIGNYSSGKMGYAIAENLAEQGAEVFLVSGPTNLKINNSAIKIIDVKNAAEMYEQSVKYFKKSTIAVLSAAVADYTPTSISSNKIKKSNDSILVNLKKTKDILKQLGAIKKQNQILIGFALETDNEEKNALKKLKEKNADMIVLNSLKNKGAGFKYDTNQITIYTKKGAKIPFPLKSKQDVASDIVNQIIIEFNA